MRLYHRSDERVARGISVHGFRDEWGYYLTDQLWHGVWLCEDTACPSGYQHGDSLLAVDLDVSAEELRVCRWLDPGRNHRDYLVPAQLLQGKARIQLVPLQDVNNDYSSDGPTRFE